MDGPSIYRTKLSKSKRERQTPHDITYMCNLKYDANELIYETETDIENGLVVAKREVGRGGFGLGVWDKQMQTITYRMNEQQGLLFSTGNYIQYPVINQ